MSNHEEQEIKFQLYEQFAEIGKALGSARRLLLIELLAQSEYTVEKLAEEAGMSVANTSQHLKTLRVARMVDVRRQGVVAHYRLADDAVFQTWQMMRQLGEVYNAEIERLARRLWPDRDPQALVLFENLLPLLGQDSIVVLDVRPDREYKAGHIPGAVSIPLAELPDRMAEINKEHELIVYCRGPYSTLSDQAVQLLQATGYDVKRLALGFPEWRTEGLPIQAGVREMLPAH